MAAGKKPVGRITVRNAESKKEATIGKLWPEGTPGHEHPKLGISLGETAFGDRPAVSQGEALALLQKATTKGSGYFCNMYIDRAAMLAHLGAEGGSDQAPAADESGEYDEVPF